MACAVCGGTGVPNATCSSPIFFRGDVLRSMCRHREQEVGSAKRCVIVVILLEGKANLTH